MALWPAAAASCAFLAAALLPGPARAWWSGPGSTHRTLTAAAIASLDKAGFPDVAGWAAEAVLRGADSEDAHPRPGHNGGRPEELWLGARPWAAGGALGDYARLRFGPAYERIGALCHLAQDQAVPAHAANIPHGEDLRDDSFEAYARLAPRLEVSLRPAGPGGKEPHLYYQDVQDETRRSLPWLVDPRTGWPYWMASASAPPAGKDATFGPAGRYGGRRDSYAYAVSWEPPRFHADAPELAGSQASTGASATADLLRAASARLPPLVANLSLSSASVAPGESAAVRFSIFDNRSSSMSYTLWVRDDGRHQGEMASGSAELKAPSGPDMVLSARVEAGWTGMLDGKILPPGNYVIEVRLVDGDGNRPPPEVNEDDVAANDTMIALTVAAP